MNQKTVSASTNPGSKPRDDEIDVYGLTHPGKVRKANRDHFLICSLRKEVQVHLTSLPDAEQIGGDPERLAFVAMVADGVGSLDKAGEASRLALENITSYISRSLQTYYTTDAANEKLFAQELVDAALRCHSEIEQHGSGDDELEGMATTLTLWLGVWPKAYLLQVGDSRCYIMRGDELTQISRDQTMAQEFIDQGIFTRADAQGSRLAHVLSSSIGGPQTQPIVTSMDQDWNNIGLLCSDGLTKHVSDERIAEILGNWTNAKEICETLLQEALDDGGTDNITIIAGRDIRQE